MDDTRCNKLYDDIGKVYHIIYLDHIYRYARQPAENQQLYQRAPFKTVSHGILI